MGVGGEALFRIPDADLVQQLKNAAAGLVFGDALMEGQAFADLPVDGVEGVEGRHRLLKDEADVVAPNSAEVGVRGADHLFAVIRDRPAEDRGFGEEFDRGEGSDGFA